MKIKTLIKVSLIGAGRIGALYDLTNDSYETSRRSHLGAIIENSFLELHSIVDPNPDKASLQKKWSSLNDYLFFSSLDEINNIEDVDVFILATHLDKRDETLKTLSKLNPKVLIIEKPFAATISQAQTITNLFDGSKTQLRVNFHRRFSTKINNSLKNISKIKKITVQYNNGFKNYCSHALDFAVNLLGPAISMAKTHSEKDHYSFVLNFKDNIQGVFNAFPEASYDLLDIDVYTDKKCFHFKSGGAVIQVESSKKNALYDGYESLAIESEDKSPLGGMDELYEAIVAHLKEGCELLGCTPKEAVHIVEIQEKIEAVDIVNFEKGLL